MIQLESMLQLVGNGNPSTVEEEWMKLVEAPDLPLNRLASYHPVLTELCKIGRNSHAESLAWAAIEAVSSRKSPVETLVVAGPFLQGLGESKDLREQVTKLYRDSHGSIPNLDGLLTAAGLPAGRPVRRALRTMDVAVSLNEGDFLRSRDDDGAAKVMFIDRDSWTFTIDTGGDTETLDAVNLADRYRKADSNDLGVLKVFSPDDLAKRVAEDHSSILVQICREYGGKIDSEKLESILVNNILDEGEWSKWWTKARTVSKKCANLKIEGRSPYLITFVDAPSSAEEAVTVDFDAARSPIAHFLVVDRYLRDCKTEKKATNDAVVKQCYGQLVERARRLEKEHVAAAGLYSIMVRRIGEMTGMDGCIEDARKFFATNPHPEKVIQEMDHEGLLSAAFSTWAEARPETWQAEVLKLIPSWTRTACDVAASKLVSAGCGLAEFEPVVQEILAQPVKHFDALLWLWDGPSKGKSICNLPLFTLLMRLVRIVEDCRRADHLPKDVVKNVQASARNVLSARRCERFVECLDTMDAGMAAALRTHLGRMDALGRAVREDLMRHLKNRFPVGVSTPAVAPWLREDVIFVTAEGLSKKHHEKEHHVNVKMRDNARAIGAAAELGDLSENSEYKFALEERDLLQARLAQMNSELSIARVMNPEDITIDQVGVGCRVVFKRTTDQSPYEVTFLGPWEADATQGKFNYKTPLALKVLGKKVGDVVDFDHSGASGSYEIVEIHNNLLE